MKHKANVHRSDIADKKLFKRTLPLLREGDLQNIITLQGTPTLPELSKTVFDLSNLLTKLSVTV